MGKTKRINATKEQRTTSCECCDYPLSQRHHILEVAVYGENRMVAQLCANCHELYHIAHRARVLKSKKSIDAFAAVTNALGDRHHQIRYVNALVDEAIEIKQAVADRVKEWRSDPKTAGYEPPDMMERCIDSVLVRGALEIIRAKKEAEAAAKEKLS